MNIVISQPMYFPWIGIFEQVKLSQIFVHYTDVQLPQGRSFTTRVQIKGERGQIWLSVPIRHSGKQLIQDAIIDDSQDWRSKHENLLASNYRKAPFFEDMMTLFREVTSVSDSSLSELNIRSIEAVTRYFGISSSFKRSSEFPSSSTGSERLLEICMALNATKYITGHGARNYLDHNLFDQKQIAVEYMKYERRPYSQQWSGFEPHVSILDLIANMGPAGIAYIASKTKPWRDFVNE